MSIDVNDYEYMPNVFYSDISVTKVSNGYELYYTVFFQASLSDDYKAHDISLKHLVSLSDKDSQEIVNGSVSLESKQYHEFHISQFKVVEFADYKLYSLQKEMLLSENDFDSLYLFSCLSFNGKHIYNGPIKGEKIFNIDGSINNSNFSFFKDGQEYGGPVHMHEETFMEGSFHTDETHSILERRQYPDNKIFFLPEENFQVSQAPVEEFKSFFCFPFVEDVDGKNSFIFTINPTQISLQSSRVSRVLKKQNPKLFYKLAQYLKIKTIKIHREIKEEVEIFNKLNLSNIKLKSKKSEIICDSELNFNNLKKTERFLLNNNVYVNINKESLPEFNDVVNPNQTNVSKQHVEVGKQISSIESVDISEDDLDYFKFTDYEVKDLLGGPFYYSIDVSIEDYISEYIEEKILRFRKVCQEIISEIEDIDYAEDEKVSKEFLDRFCKKNDILIGEDFFPIDGQGDKITNTFFYKGVVEYLNVFELVSAEEYNFQTILEGLNIFKTNYRNLSQTKERFLKLLAFVERVYRLKKIEENFENTSVMRERGNQYFVFKSHQIQEPFLKSISDNISYSFVQSKRFEGILTIDSYHLELRSRLEKEKYLSGNLSASDPILANIRSDQRQPFTEINKTLKKYLTPVAIRVGNNTNFLGDISIHTAKEDYLNTLSYSRLAAIYGLGAVYGKEEFMSAVMPMVSVDNRPPGAEMLASRNLNLYYQADKVFSEDILSRFSKEGSTSREENLSTGAELSAMLESSLYNKKIQKPFLLKNFDLTKSENKFSDSEIDYSDIPIQIKSLMASKSNSVRNRFADEQFNDLADSKSIEAMYQFFANIKVLKVFLGFEKIGENYNFSSPMYQDLDYDLFLDLVDSNFICLVSDYSSPHLVEYEKDFKILDSVMQVMNRDSVVREKKNYTANKVPFILSREKKYSRTITVKQNLENFGRALVLPIRNSNSQTNISTQTNVSTTNNLNMGTTNVNY